MNTASYGANKLEFDVGEFVHINLGEAEEEYVQTSPDSVSDLIVVIQT